jgi:hydroxymethylglutaryl-CoA lyase
MSVWQGNRRRIFIQEVGPRDGLQAESRFVPSEEKIALIDALSPLGLAKIEVTAFVSPKAIPSLADAEAVMHGIRRAPGTLYTALVPNVRGAERALACGADELNFVMSATEAHNLANLRMTREQSFGGLREVAELADRAGIPVTVSLSCGFGCPMEGDVETATVLQWAGRFRGELGVRSVALCDTTGMAYPTRVHALVQAFRERWPDTALTLHFHDTRGLGLANLLAAIDAGADRFDASLGGIGGCPNAPGATGNVCTEDTVHALELMGYDTGVNLAGLIDASRRLPALIGHDTPGQVAKAGPRLQLHPVPHDLDAIRERAHARR